MSKHTPGPWYIDVDHATSNAEYIRALQDGTKLPLITSTTYGTRLQRSWQNEPRKTSIRYAHTA